MTIKKAALSSRWMSPTDVFDRLRQARENKVHQTKLLSSLEEQAKQRRDSIERSLESFSPAQRRDLVNRSMGGFRVELKRLSADTRLRHMRTAGRLYEETLGARAHFQSPVQMLMRESLGSERRSRLLHQIESSGPVELSSLAALAASTKDKELGAALCSRVSTLQPSERPFSSNELADAIVGEDYRKITQALMEVDRITQEVAHADTAFERGGVDAARTVRLARMRRAEAEIGADLSELPETEFTTEN